MASEWQTITLKEANVTLIDCDHRTPPAATGGYPYVAIPQLCGGRIELADARRITPEHYADWTRKAKPSANDVVLSRRCNPGETAVVPRDAEFALGQNLVLLRADGTSIYPPYLRWLVRGREWWEQIGKFINVGAVFDSLRCADVPNFDLLVPPLPEQRAIAHILGTLDDKIELNRRMSETLEAMARALFKSWFVDFDPVRAKAEGRDPGLPKPLAAWGIADGLGSNKFEFRQGEILFGKLRPYFHKVGVAPVSGVCSTDIVVVRPRSDLWFGFVLGHVSSADFVEYTNAGSTGTKMPRTNWTDMGRYELALPPAPLAAAFATRMRSSVERTIAGIHESRTLAALRDTLLPKLISGELRLKDVARWLTSI